jgi:hypothetical protein
MHMDLWNLDQPATEMLVVQCRTVPLKTPSNTTLSMAVATFRSSLTVAGRATLGQH